jgi:hypothetical protein
MQLSQSKPDSEPSPWDPRAQIAPPQSPEAAGSLEPHPASFPLEATRALSRLLVEQVERADSISCGSLALHVANFDRLLAATPTRNQISDALDGLTDLLVGVDMNETCPEIRADLVGIVAKMRTLTGLPYTPLAL